MYHLFRSEDRAYQSGAILLSRQALRPCGKCGWVKQSVRAIQWLKENDFTLCTSLGLQTWDLITSLGAIHDLGLEILIPCADRDDFRTRAVETCTQFNLNRLTTRFLPVFNHDETDDVRQKRDREIIARAKVILPVSIRPGGYMDSLIKEREPDDKAVNRDFAIEYEGSSAPMAYKIDPEKINPRLRWLEDSFLIHWTRTCNSAWPTERLIDYYRAVLESNCYPRSAFDTLKNILRMKTVVASSKNMPGKTATVSFSNCPPLTMVKLMTWRARYRVMSFEPYGIGIDKQTALAMNILPVNYYDRNGGAAVDTKHWLSQSRGEKSDWTAEDEYRHRGDVDISAVPSDKLIILCRAKSESEAIASRTGLKAMPFTLDEN